MANTEFKQQILFIKDVERLIGRNRNTLRRWWLTGKFPRPVKIHDSLLTWHYVVIEQWIDQMLTTKDSNSTK
ncbi:helix-turn-helix transcriptional regulator [Legionella spiritensis]|uniref:Prophage regulatory protein-like protein n=1 Tax=Legionella spiritensis TaxID=452 RepID=A0A0W0Z8A6_LEGSP|nr:AlpA family phage regulatory protein [Legionella spiritensis]KTD65348.1 prophage regulatory protein-like protein [Legionella spiritensis]SNV47367.1 prophage regulatory protein-like protein [Legionella spiritensis]